MSGEPPNRSEYAQLGHEAHQFVSLIRAMESGDEDLEMWLAVYGRIALPAGMTKAVAAATSSIIGTKYMAAVLVAQHLAHRVALLDGTSMVDVLNEAEQRIVDAARRPAEDE